METVFEQICEKKDILRILRKNLFDVDGVYKSENEGVLGNKS